MNHNPDRHHDKGAVLPLLALLILPLILVMGFTVDVGLILNTKNQQSLITQHAALSALSEYVKVLAHHQGDGDKYEAAVHRAKETASRVAKVNVTLIDRVLKNRNDRIGDSIEDVAVSDGEDQDSSHEAELEFGRYIHTDESDANEDPDSAPECEPSPCFIRQSVTAEDNNAIRFTMRVAEENPLKTFFLKFVGISQMRHKESAVATLIPRNDMFLIDLSPTVYYENYSQQVLTTDEGATIDGSRSKFSYALADTYKDFIIPSGARIGETCGEPDANCQLSSSSDTQIWASQLFQSVEGEQPHPMVKYRDDYRVHKVTFNKDQINEYFDYFLVHSYDRDAETGLDTFPRPEPLASILRSVHGAMDILQSRALVNDKIGIFGFDSESNSTTSQQGLYVSDEPRFLDISTPSLASSNFLDFFEATRYETRDDFEKSLSLALFPRPGRYSDLHSALYLALGKISTAGSLKIGKNSVFLFTDGLANCAHDVVLNEEGKVLIPFKKYSDSDYPYPCEHSGKYIHASIASITDPVFIDAFKSREISVNIALVGANSGAHFLARKSNSNGCVEHVEAAKYSHDMYVNSGIPETVTETYIQELDDDLVNNRKLYVANELYKLVHETRGLWVPIMAQAFYTGPNDEKIPLNFNADLNSACSDLEEPGEVLADYIIEDPNGQPVQVTDSEGRVLFDPLGRTAEKQLKDAMEKVLQSPFVLATERH